jgi:putative modified peptide
MRIEADITREQAIQLAEKLANDDSFRARIESDPQAALGEFHISIPQGAVPRRVTLPPKEHLQAAILRSGGQRTASGQVNVDAEDAHWAFLVFIAFL